MVIPVHHENNIACGSQPYVTLSLLASCVIVFVYLWLLPAGARR
jgi:hypothetical protein